MAGGSGAGMGGHSGQAAGGSGAGGGTSLPECTYPLWDGTPHLFGDHVTSTCWRPTPDYISSHFPYYGGINCVPGETYSWTCMDGSGCPGYANPPGIETWDPNMTSQIVPWGIPDAQCHP
jgi:hypothetical protein